MPKKCLDAALVYIITCIHQLRDCQKKTFKCKKADFVCVKGGGGQDKSAKFPKISRQKSVYFKLYSPHR